MVASERAAGAYGVANLDNKEADAEDLAILLARRAASQFTETNREGPFLDAVARYQAAISVERRTAYETIWNALYDIGAFEVPYKESSAKQAQLPSDQQGGQVTPPTPPSAPGSGDQNHQNDVVDDTSRLTPTAKFNDIVSLMANRAAARHFSTPNDDEVQQIADNLGLDSDEIKKSLYVTATFGDAMAANGVVGKEEVPSDYQEVQIQGIGGRVEASEAIVPTGTAVRKVAEDLGATDAQIYDAIRDSYGDDLSDEYHTSVNGEHHYYLPSSMLANAQPQQLQEQPQQQGPPNPQQAVQQAQGALLERDHHIAKELGRI